MSETSYLGLFKHDDVTTNEDSFDIEKSLNENWNKVDENAKVMQENIQQNTTAIANLADNQITGTVEGESIYIDDVYSGGTAKISLKGKSEQEGTPTPDTPVEIQNIEGDIKVSAVGKNLFNINETTARYGDVDLNISNNKIVLTATGTTGSQIVQNIVSGLDKDKKYTFSFKAKKTVLGADGLPYISIAFFGSNDGETYNAFNTLKVKDPTENTEYSETVVISGYSYYRFYIYNNSSTPVTVGEQTEYYDIQLEEGAEITDYEPYQSQTANFTFTEGQKLMEGSYLADDGVHNSHAQETVNINGIITLSNGNVVGVYYPTNKIKKIHNYLVCSKAIATKTGDELYLQEGTVYENETNVCLVGNSTDTLESIKAKYDGAILEYELAEPVIIPYTTEQQAQWDKLQSLQLFDGVNNISSPATMQLTYVKLTESVINNLQDQINELKQALVNLGGI